MNFFVIKAFVKNMYVWIKNHWYVPLSFIAASITWFFFRQKSQVMVENVKKTREVHKKEINIINDAHEKEVLSRDKSLNKFVESNKILEEALEEKTKEIEHKETDRKSELVNKSVEELAQDFADSLARTSATLSSIKEEKK